MTYCHPSSMTAIYVIPNISYITAAYVKRAWPSLWEEEADWETGDTASFNLRTEWERLCLSGPVSESLSLWEEEVDWEAEDVTPFDLGMEWGMEENTCLPDPKSFGVEGEGVEWESEDTLLGVGLGMGADLEGPCILGPDSVPL